MSTISTRQEAVQALRKLLRKRLEARRGAGVELGATDRVPLNFPPRGKGQAPMNTFRVGDLTLDADGRVLVGEIVDMWPDDVHKDVHKKLIPWLLDEVNELEREGILRRDSNGHVLFITSRGERLIDAGSDGLHGPPLEEIAETFREEHADAPHAELMTRYLSEAVSAYERGLDLAAATMIGCVYELALYELCDAVLRSVSGDVNSLRVLNRTQRNALTRYADNEPTSAVHLEDAVATALTDMGKAKLGAHADWVSSGFRATFVLVRKLRNAAGHPTGLPVPRDEVRTYISLLPGWYRHARAIDTLLS